MFCGWRDLAPAYERGCMFTTMKPGQAAGERSTETGQGAPDGQPRGPAIQLPKGGGAIRGLGEKFGANLVTGPASMSVPIATSAGRSGFSPQLSLAYDSGSGKGPFGFGWSLSIPPITRKTYKGLPGYQDADESDVFILSGAEDLVPALKQDRVSGEWEKDVVPRRMLGADEFAVQRFRTRMEWLLARRAVDAEA
jgi:hypothetical protein